MKNTTPVGLLRKTFRRAKRIVLGGRLERSQISKISKKLPFSQFIQTRRSLELQGITDEFLEQIVADNIKYTFENYGIIFDDARIVSLIESVKAAEPVDGDIAECGVYHGSSAKIIRWFASSKKILHCFDTFSGFTSSDRQIETEKGLKRDPGAGHTNTSLDMAKARIFSKIGNRSSPAKIEGVVFHQGPVQETLGQVSGLKFSLVHLDMDLYAPTKEALEFFIPRLSPNGILLLNDFTVGKNGYSGVIQAFREVDSESLVGPLPFGDQSTVLFVKKASKQ